MSWEATRKRLEECLMEKLKQKLSGIALIIAGILSVIPDHDATAAAIIVPLGLYLVFTREQVVEF